MIENKWRIICDIYINDRFIARGQHSERKRAQMLAYLQAAKTLTSHSGQDVIDTFTAVEEKNFRGPNTLDVVYKGIAQKTKITFLKQFFSLFLSLHIALYGL